MSLTGNGTHADCGRIANALEAAGEFAESDGHPSIRSLVADDYEIIAC